jgi:catechol 2,3-dioxygenase-like lactoylglutathione lyase family enzyme
MPKLAPMAGNHVNLSVRDLERSVEWYCRVFGLTVVGDEGAVPAATDRPLRYRSLGDLTTMSYVVGLIEHPDGEESPFDERRCGLDHFALHVSTPEDVEEWAEHLRALGVEHSGPKTVSYATAITLRDPDGIQLEIACPDVSFWATRFMGSAEPGGS